MSNFLNYSNKKKGVNSMYKFIQLDENETIIINGGESLFYDIGKATGYAVHKLCNFIIEHPIVVPILLQTLI